MTKSKVEEHAIPASQVKPGMVIKLTMIQAWCYKEWKMVPYSSTLVIEDSPEGVMEQLAEIDQYFMDVQVVSADEHHNGDSPTMVRIVHCVDRSEHHTIYLVPEETVTVIGSFPLTSKSAQKRNRNLSRNPALGARRQ